MNPWDSYATPQPDPSAAPVDPNAVPVVPQQEIVVTAPRLGLDTPIATNPTADGADAPAAPAAATPAPTTTLPWGDYITPQQSPLPKGDAGTPDEMLGFGREAARPLENASYWIESGLNKLGIPAAQIDHSLGMPSAQDMITNSDQIVASAAKQGRVPGALGSAFGSIVGTAPTMMAGGEGVLPAILQGAAGSALTSKNPNDAAAVGGNALTGGVLGGLGYGLLRGAGALLSPNISGDVATLKNAGVSLTPGQLLGGAAHRIEDSLTSVPILGDAIRNAQLNGLKTFNQAAFQRALTPIGETMPSGVVGRNAVAFVQNKLGDAYDALAPQLTAKQDMPFWSDAITARSQLGNSSPKWSNEFDRILHQEVLPRFDASGTLSGQDAKDVDQIINDAISTYAPNSDPGAQALTRSLGGLGDAVQSSLARNSGQAAVDRLNAINEGYANFVRPQIAASSLGAKGGVFTAPQLNAAVRSATDSVRKLAYGRGDALMMDLSDAGANVLPSQVPDSGTAMRWAMSELPILAGVGSESHVLSLGALGKIMLGGGVAGSVYTKPGMAVLNKVIDSRPALAPARAAIDSAAVPAAAKFGLFGSGLNQWLGQNLAPQTPPTN